MCEVSGDHDHGLVEVEETKMSIISRIFCIVGKAAAGQGWGNEWMIA